MPSRCSLLEGRYPPESLPDFSVATMKIFLAEVSTHENSLSEFNQKESEFLFTRLCPTVTGAGGNPMVMAGRL